MTISVDGGTGCMPEEPPGINPDFLAEWEAMSEAEYAASIRDVPDAVLDAAPPDDLPEHIWLALAEAEEAARFPDPLADPAGPVLAQTLAERLATPRGVITDTEVGDGSLVDAISGFERQASWAAAGQVQMIAELARRRVAAGGQEELVFVVDEIALALICSRYAAWSRLHTALDLVDRLPDTLSALRTGRICTARARVIAEGTRALSDEHAAVVQEEVLGGAEGLTPSQLRARVSAAAAAVDPGEDDEAHEDACAARAVRKYPREHGMTGIWALLPADHAAAVWAAVTTHAETGREPGDDRTADQRRADSLTDLATAYLDGTCPADLPGAGAGKAATGAKGADSADSEDSARMPTGTDSARMPTGTTGATGGEAGSVDRSADPPGGSGSSAGLPGCVLSGGHRPPRVPSWCRVQVKVSADWLLGRSTEAPLLGGYGPVPGEVALRLLAEAGWQRIVYDPLTGALLDVGSTVHDPPAALCRFVLTRDGGCTQPICGTARVDLDHNVSFPHGPTSAANLRFRCRHHHRGKQHPDWQARVRPDGRIDWVRSMRASLASLTVRSAPRAVAGPAMLPDSRLPATAIPSMNPIYDPDPAPGHAQIPISDPIHRRRPTHRRSDPLSGHVEDLLSLSAAPS